MGQIAPAHPSTSATSPPQPQAADAAATNRAEAALPPLQDRTPEQLRDGLKVEMRGATDDALAAARLIQDAAEFVAGQSGTTMGLSRVYLNDKHADRRGALGTAHFQGTNGVFTLSTRSTTGVLEGIERLRERPWDKWTQTERQAFVQANETILHEAAHVTLPEYTRDMVASWIRAYRPIEEASANLTEHHLTPEFFEHEFGFELDPMSIGISESTDSYTRFSERVDRLIKQASGGDATRQRELTLRLANDIPPHTRQAELASVLASGLGGDNVPDAVVREIEKTIPGFVNEEVGTRTRLMEIQAWLVDHKAGQAPPADELIQKLAELDRQAAGAAAAKPQ